MKKILSVLLVVCLCAALGACKKEGSSSEGASVVPGASTVAPSTPGGDSKTSGADTTTPVSSKPVAPGKMGDISKQFAQILASGKYRLQFDVVMPGDSNSVESKYDMAVSGGKTYVRLTLGQVGNEAQQAAMAIETITRDGKVYSLSAQTKTYTEEAIGSVGTGAIDANGLTFVEKGEEDGAAYEEYSTAGGGTIRLFVKDGKLTRITSAAEKLTLEMENVNLTSDVPDSLFEIPKDFKKE